jgi:hypothetical protein
LLKKRRIWIIMCVFIAVALGAVGAAIGVTMHSRNAKGKGTTCGGNLVGAACNLGEYTLCGCKNYLIISRCYLCLHLTCLQPLRRVGTELGYNPTSFFGAHFAHILTSYSYSDDEPLVWLKFLNQSSL